MLWKNKNSFIFEGKEYEAEVTVAKCLEDSKRWFDVIAVSKEGEGGRNRLDEGKKRWKAPEAESLKCNIGISWTQRNQLAGMGWIVRNRNGETVLHSRRAFNGVSSLLEAKRLGLIWAAESMVSHGLQNVIFEIEASELVGAITRPRAWPAFRAYGLELRDVLSNVTDWKVNLVTREANRSAFLIARSVTKELRFQSYVAQGSPRWLQGLLAEEGTRNRV
ncbi:unnamed protein product [Brassica rapa subsp. narinosa]